MPGPPGLPLDGEPPSLQADPFDVGFAGLFFLLGAFHRGSTSTA
jgi:hypothetical protein